MRVTVKTYSERKNPKGFIMENRRQLKQEKIVRLIDNLLTFSKGNQLTKITIELHRQAKKSK